MRQDEKRQAKKDEETKGYGDYNWEELYKSGNVKKLKVAELNKYIFSHNLSRRKMSKSEKLNLLSAHISKGLCERILILSAAETALATEDSDTQSEDDDVRDRCTIQPQTMFVRRKGWVTINFTASWGGSHFLTKNIKGGLGDFTFMLIGIPAAHPPF